MQPELDAGHEAGAHGGDNGGDHQHAHPEGEEPNRKARWAERAKVIATGIATIFFGLILFAVAGWVGSRFSAISRLEDEIARLKTASEGKAEKGDLANLAEKVDSKAEALPVQNLLNGDKEEIEKLRQLVSVHNASYNNAVGKYDTLLQKHEVEVASLRTQAACLCEKAAKLEVQAANGGADLKHLRDVKIDKLTADIAMLRERIASLEASLKGLESKK